jgi:hypothetical protein
MEVTVNMSLCHTENHNKIKALKQRGFGKGDKIKKEIRKRKKGNGK